MSVAFESWNSYWVFARAIRYGSRFLHDDQVLRFLKAVADSTEVRSSVIPPNRPLWRAQLGHDFEKRSQDDVTWDEPVPFRSDRMKPLRHSANEGRVNPRGIPCLYAANDKETAIAEVRPWLKALVSVAQLRTARELRLVNCSAGHDTSFDLYLEEPQSEEREKVVWREIGRAFSNPVTVDPGVAEYAPTQVLAEHFRKAGYDGVVYKSKLGPGFNFALFDLDALQVVDVRLYPVEAVNYVVGEMKSSYVVKHKEADA